MICRRLFLGCGQKQELGSDLLINGLRYSTIELKENTVVVVLGASGDLAKKKTVSSSPILPLFLHD